MKIIDLPDGYMDTPVASSGMTFAEFLERWLKARERIIERHRKLSWRQKRGGKKGENTQRIRMDYQTHMLNQFVPVRELAPKKGTDWVFDETEHLLLDGLVEVDPKRIYGFELMRPVLMPDVYTKLVGGKITPAQAAEML